MKAALLVAIVFKLFTTSPIPTHLLHADWLQDYLHILTTPIDSSVAFVHSNTADCSTILLSTSSSLLTSRLTAHGILLNVKR
ncbi:hypothetical protein AVEN_39451-1 [Araneus ventricosus]|uniref:Secreted protein n=1 Tax=Araneus ventricosus TaxID=182803 RepID=A0A4Y2D778_ARAVE|nr:hypothetical protein AVEN_39451-1 [Araneus ventricosus]